MSKIIGLFELAFVLAFHGDGPGARAAADATIEASRDCPGFVERAIQTAIAIACLADGDLETARQAALPQKGLTSSFRSGRPAHGLGGPSRLGLWRA